ncbi:MAG: GIY-YIG nuclease family protein [Sedimentisphaerales bacterium]|nr:GIY-YIG nuclease family protein [Sedimentisphaerales bacterium]
MGQYFIYILASKKNGTLYIGVTNNLIKRISQHKDNLVEGFTKRYGIHTLVYYEIFRNIQDAITREKNIKKWKRKWKMELIEKSNPNWEDLYDTLST